MTARVYTVQIKSRLRENRQRFSLLKSHSFVRSLASQLSFVLNRLSISPFHVIFIFFFFFPLVFSSFSLYSECCVVVILLYIHLFVASLIDPFVYPLGCSKFAAVAAAAASCWGVETLRANVQ
jgi:hypothetical protein